MQLEYDDDWLSQQVMQTVGQYNHSWISVPKLSVIFSGVFVTLQSLYWIAWYSTLNILVDGSYFHVLPYKLLNLRWYNSSCLHVKFIPKFLISFFTVSIDHYPMKF
jgi:hypothetical protein